MTVYCFFGLVVALMSGVVCGVMAIALCKVSGQPSCNQDCMQGRDCKCGGAA